MELVLGPVEDVVPEARLAVALHFRQVEVRSAAALEQPPRVVEHVETEVEHRAGDRRTVDQEMALHEVPATGPDDEGRGLLRQLVLATVRILERDRLVDRVDEVPLTFDHVGPRRRVRVFEVGHVDGGPGVQRVDDHLAIRWSGDLDLPNTKILRHIGDAPILLTNVGGTAQEVERAAVPQLLVDLGAPCQPLQARAQLERGPCPRHPQSHQ